MPGVTMTCSFCCDISGLTFRGECACGKSGVTVPYTNAVVVMVVMRIAATSWKGGASEVLVDPRTRGAVLLPSEPVRADA